MQLFNGLMLKRSKNINFSLIKQHPNRLIMDLSSIYKFNIHNTTWEVFKHTPQVLPPPDQLKVVTFNVLFDAWWGKPYKHHIVCPGKRFAHQFQLLEKMDADVIGLNEVTSNYIDKITMQKWVQESYYISDYNGSTINNFGNLILSKYPIAELRLATLPQLKRVVPCIKIAFEDKNLVFASTHLSAQKENVERRQVQIHALIDFIQKYYPTDDKVILGDLNFHVESELIPPNYQDAWKTLYPDNPGYTFDGTINTMLHEIWPLGWVYGFKDNVQMRLDRVFTQTNNWNVSAMDICFNQPIYQSNQRTNLIKDILSTAFDFFKVNIARDPKKYLFPSDHFGLRCIFTKK